MADEQKTSASRQEQQSSKSDSSSGSSKSGSSKSEAKPMGGGTLPGPSGTPEQRAGATQGREYSTGQKRAEVNRREAGDDVVPGTPRAVTTPKYAEPGVDVSNADLNMSEVSAIAEHSTYVENPDPNPAGLRPAPGRSTVQVLGSAETIEESDEPVNNKMMGAY